MTYIEGNIATVISGSYRRHLGQMYRLKRTLERRGITVLSPIGDGAINPGEELCGALIRADAYGWACPGDPVAAAVLAHRDATLTHVRTGVYAAMWVAAAVATAGRGRRSATMRKSEKLPPVPRAR